MIRFETSGITPPRRTTHMGRQGDYNWKALGLESVIRWGGLVHNTAKSIDVFVQLDLPIVPYSTTLPSLAQVECV